MRVPVLTLMMVLLTAGCASVRGPSGLDTPSAVVASESCNQPWLGVDCL